MGVGKDGGKEEILEILEDDGRGKLDENIIEQKEGEGGKGRENGRGQTDSGQTGRMSGECGRE